MGELIYLDEYLKDKQAKDEQQIQELKDELQRLILENNLNFCEYPIISWYNINDSGYPDDQAGRYCVVDPGYYLDCDYGFNPEDE
jgi:hypothetical protein